MDDWLQLISDLNWKPLADFVGLLCLIATAIFAALSARAASEAAKAAAASADTADQALRVTQRAYLSVEPRGIKLQRVPGGRVLGHVGIRNAGHLPARNVDWFIDIKFSKCGDVKVFPIDESKIKGNVVTPPSTTMPRGTKKSIPVADIAREAGGSLENRETETPVYLYVWGIVRYHDGFRPSRFTKFCHRYNWIAREDDGYQINKEEGRYHEHGNATDESEGDT